MSRGYFSCYEMVAEDDHAVIYAYRGEDWNLPKDMQEEIAFEGSFTISRDALEEPEVRTRRTRRTRRRKDVLSRVVPHFPHVWNHVADGGIVIDDLCGLDIYEQSLDIKWIADGDHPTVLTDVLIDIYYRYMLEGALPRKGAFVR